MIEVVLFGSISQLLNEPERQMSIITKAMKRQVCCELRGPSGYTAVCQLHVACVVSRYNLVRAWDGGWRALFYRVSRTSNSAISLLHIHFSSL